MDPLTPLREEDVDGDPFTQFGRWWEEAQRSGGSQPDAMCLATATPDGRPSARMVLLKGFGPDGFVFYTNYRSRKGRELAANPFGAIVLSWIELRRQVRAAGRVERVSAEQSQAYFRTRPRDAQLSALASPQSEVIRDRAWLEERVAGLAARHAEAEVPLPEGWGGYRLRPEEIEFWQGAPHRLHDRLRYTPEPGGGWRIERLAP